VRGETVTPILFYPVICLPSKTVPRERLPLPGTAHSRPLFELHPAGSLPRFTRFKSGSSLWHWSSDPRKICLPFQKAACYIRDINPGCGCGMFPLAIWPATGRFPTCKQLNSHLYFTTNRIFSRRFKSDKILLSSYYRLHVFEFSGRKGVSCFKKFFSF